MTMHSEEELNAASAEPQSTPSTESETPVTEKPEAEAAEETPAVEAEAPAEETPAAEAEEAPAPAEDAPATEEATAAEEAPAAAEEATEDAAKEGDDQRIETVEAEDDHEQPRQKKLSIPDFTKMSLEEVLDAIRAHMAEHSPERIKGIVESGRSHMLMILNAERDEAKAKFIEEGGNNLDFHYDQPLRKELGGIYGNYRDALRKYYKDLSDQLDKNLEKKNSIIEAIKGLPMQEGSAKQKYDAFKELRASWNATGLVPKGDAGMVWANFNHHVDNFFDYLRMAYDLIEKDYENNLAEKTAICETAEGLAKEEASPKMFSTLQQLHAKWKRVGPVPKEHKEPIWERFKAATAAIHGKRNEFNEAVKRAQDEKLALKREVVKQIWALQNRQFHKHSDWQKATNDLQALRDQFKKIGFVKSDENDAIWEDYKEAQKKFNALKNAFYKNEKKSQRENLEKKRELVALAESVKDSEDIKATIAILKKAQADWKKIGYVSKKEGDQVWADFRAACNHFFDKLKGERKAQEAAANAVVKAKNDLLGKLKKAKITSLDEAIEWTTQWGASGDAGKKNGALNNAFDEALADKAKGLGMDEMGLKSALFEAKVKALVEADDQHGLRREREWLRKNQDTAEKELHQLENNIAFFSGSNNPLLEAANARIAEQKAAVEQWQALRKSFNRLLK